jgi:flagellar hook-length control protein FliK
VVSWTASEPTVGRPAEGPRTEAGRQLAPVLARILTTAENGAPTTHRVTLRLHPEELGEVRVALTVRDGQVQVTLSAGETARDLLRRDSGLLHHLLGQRGAERVEVAFRALPGSERREPGPGVIDQGAPAGDPGSGGSTGRDPRDARPAFTGEGRHPWHGRGAAPAPRGGTAAHTAPPLGSVRPHAGLDITV